MNIRCHDSQRQQAEMDRRKQDGRDEALLLFMSFCIGIFVGALIYYLIF